MQIKSANLKINLSGKRVFVVGVVVAVFALIIWRYYNVRNYDWSGIYASQNCSHADVDHYINQTENCIIVITQSSRGVAHGFDISSAPRTSTYTASGNLVGRYLRRVDINDNELWAFISPIPNPDDNPKDVVGLAFAQGHPATIRYDDKTYHRVDVDNKQHNTPTSTVTNRYRQPKYILDVIQPSLYYAIMPSSIWTANDGSTLLLQNTLSNSCYLPHKDCPNLLLTKGNYTESLSIGDLTLISEDAYHGTLTMASNTCGRLDNKTMKTVSVGKVETFVFGFDVNGYVNPQLKTLDFSIAGKPYHYTLSETSNQMPRRSDLGMSGLNINSHYLDEQSLKANSTNYDGCNLWRTPN